MGVEGGGAWVEVAVAVVVLSASRASTGEAVVTGNAATRSETKAIRVEENCILAVMFWRKLEENGS